MGNKKKIRVALAGNPNSGKSSIFNALTGARQKVGNWPGVTVEKKVGYFKIKDVEIELIDLPGTYSLRTKSIDEKIARDFILNTPLDLVLVVVDASNLERNLYLFMRIIEYGLPVILILNMMDVAKKFGYEINVPVLQKILKIPVVTTVGNKSKGIDRLKEKIYEIVVNNEKPTSFAVNHGEIIADAMKRLREVLLKDKDFKGKITDGFLLTLLAKEPDSLKSVQCHKYLDEIDRIIYETEEKIYKRYHLDTENYLVSSRYGIIKGIVKEAVTKKMVIAEAKRISDKIDSIVTNRYLGIPLFLLIIWFIFQMVFTIGNPVADLLDSGFSYLSDTIKNFLLTTSLPAWVPSLVSDGIISGVGSVVVFLPNILILFFFISIMEDTGYMARAAFVMDKLMHKMGLHGKSFIPMFIGFGCNIPAILSTRTLENRKDRILTILAIPFMSCSARLPVYILFTSAFFKENQGLIVFSLYIMGIVLSILVSQIVKKIAFKKEDSPLIMELPPYRAPRFDTILFEMWNKSKSFLKKASTVILAGVVVLWFLSSFPPGVAYASRESFIGQIGSAIAPIFKPQGFAIWQIAVALMMGIFAKEIVVSTLGTVFAAQGAALKQILVATFSPVSAYALMVLVLLYTPCIATIAVIKQETGSFKWVLTSVLINFSLAYLVSMLIYQIGSLLF